VETARVALAADLAEIVSLARRLRDDMRDQRGGRLWLLECLPEPLGETLASPELRVVVGTIDDVVVGYGAASTGLLRDGSRLATVHEIYVDPGAREVSLGELMLADLVAWAEGAGCFGIDAVVLPGLREGKNLFERFGMSARSLTVHRSFAP
jgi:GNAT superfamily N-acetyltransferase